MRNIQGFPFGLKQLLSPGDQRPLRVFLSLIWWETHETEKKNYCYTHDKPDSDENSYKISVSKEKIKQQYLDKDISTLPYTRKSKL